jgi:hypothetical protein
MALRKLLLILLLASCQKDVLKEQPRGCDFGLSVNDFARNASKRSTVNARPPKGGGNPNRLPVLFLDFDGAVVSGTSWNWNGAFTCSGSGMDSIAMQETLDKAVSAFDLWNVRVTTDSVVFNAAPVDKRQRVILTTSHEWFGSAGGTAFIGSFGWPDNSPCFVFTAALGFNTKYIKEATVHELGHTLNLFHQSTWENGVLINEYNFGGNGVAPIMGNAYYQPVSVWYAGLNSDGEFQNDTLVINQLLNRR